MCQRPRKRRWGRALAYTDIRTAGVFLQRRHLGHPSSPNRSKICDQSLRASAWPGLPICHVACAIHFRRGSSKPGWAQGSPGSRLLSRRSLFPASSLALKSVPIPIVKTVIRVKVTVLKPHTRLLKVPPPKGAHVSLPVIGTFVAITVARTIPWHPASENPDASQ